MGEGETSSYEMISHRKYSIGNTVNAIVTVLRGDRQRLHL